jgi:hypothetical protein
MTLGLCLNMMELPYNYGRDDLFSTTKTTFGGRKAITESKAYDGSRPNLTRVNSKHIIYLENLYICGCSQPT